MAFQVSVFQYALLLVPVRDARSRNVINEACAQVLDKAAS